MRQEYPIAATENISFDPAASLGGRSRRPSHLSIGPALRACRTYFDWHPIIGGVVVFAASAVCVAGLSFLRAVFVPTAGGWAICTPLNGTVLAVLLMTRRKLWPFLLLGYILAVSLGIGIAGTTQRPAALEVSGNLAELLIAAFALPPFRNLKQWLQEPRLLRAFTGYALLLGPAMMALSVAQRLPGSAGGVTDLYADLWERARIVGFSESIGVALGCSVMLVLCNPQTYRLFRWRTLPGTLGLFTAQGAITWFAFSQVGKPAIFLPYAVLITITLILGLRGAVLATAIACAVISIASAHVPLSFDQASLMRSYLALTFVAAFPLGVTLFNRDEIERRVKDYQAEVDKLRSLDRLTGVANRKRFDLVIAREWQRATRDPKPIALLMIDTDFFELYVQEYGIQAGDQLLRQIASKMADQPHRAYDLVSRFEGGRFSVLLPGASGDAIKRIGEEFRAEIAALDWAHERSPFGQVTVSIGWASMLPENDTKPDLLIAAAEQALASARKNGRNRVEG